MSPKPSPKIVTSARHNVPASTHVQRHLTDAEERVVLSLAKRILHSRQTKVKADLERKKRRTSPSSSVPLWMPRVDIFDDPSCKDIIATFEVPGVPVQDMNVDIVDGKLVVEGTRQMKVKPLSTQYTEWMYPDTSDSTASSCDDTMHVDDPTDMPVPRIVVAELRYGKFRRDNIPLPSGIQKAHVNASLQNGMLKVTWPRQPKTKPVNTGDEPLAIKSEDASHLRSGGKSGESGSGK